MKEFWQRLTLVNKHAWMFLIVSFTINILGLTSSVYSIQVLNRYLALGIDGTLITLTVGAILALILELVTRSSRMHLAQWVCSKADSAYAEAAYQAMSQSRFSSIEQLQPEVRKEALSGLNTIQTSYGPQNLVSVLDAPFSLIFLVVIFLLNTTIGIAVTLLIALVILLSFFVYSSSEQPTRDLSQSMMEWNLQQGGLTNNPELLRAFPSATIISSKWKASLEKVLNFRKIVSTIQSRGTSITYASTAFQTILIYGLGAREVIEGTLNVGSLIGISILASRAMSNVTRILQLVEPVKRGKRALEQLGQLALLQMNRSNELIVTEWQGALTFEDLAFVYPGHPVPLFESLELDIPAGSVVVVCGKNATGKSSFARMLVGLLDPTRGRVRVNNLDLRLVNSAWWLEQIMYLPQEPSFFNGTVKENLSLGNENISDEKIIQLCREVGLSHFLESSTDGLSAKIINNGHTLPVGIRRRFALVRALLNDGPLAILDEPTEALDTEGCNAVAAVLNRLVREQKTVIIMSNEAFIVKSANIVIDLNVKPTPRIKIVKTAERPAVNADLLQGERIQ